jgi:type VI secretion system protein ImpL
MLVKLLIAALILLSLMFLALVWFVAVLAKISLLVPGAVTGLFALALLAAAIVPRLRARSAARGLERGLREQARGQAKLVRPDLQPELELMQGDFDKAVRALKASPLGKGGGAALYYLPWYAIIGPSGAGKTTALRHSGLRFPAGTETNRDVKVKGVGGTRNCDWWLTNDAVLLDTAGRWSTQEEDHDEWLAFLELLRKHRPRKPLNGLIAAISVGDIVNASDEEVEALARRMRERLDEVIGRLSVSLPVYVMFTKCDLIEGFVETFRGMHSSAREQVFGFTVPVTRDVGDPGSHFEQRFDELGAALDGVSLARMGEERGVEARQLIYAFPQQFVAMRSNLGRFVEVLFEPNVYQETPSLRGVYFTSGTQEGRPFSLLLDRLASALGMQERMPAMPQQVDQKSYFLRDLFMKVIFEDRELASASQAELRRQRMRRLAVMSAMTVFAIAFGVVPAYAYMQNRDQLATTAALVDRFEHKTAEPLAGQDVDFGARLSEVKEVISDLNVYEHEAPSFIATLGMYQGDRVQPHLRRYSADLLRRELLQPVIAADIRGLTDFGMRYESLPDARPTVREHGEYYDLLKLHLLLSAPRAEGEPDLSDETQRSWVTAQLARRFAGDDPSEPAQALARAFAERCTGYLVEYPHLSFTRDADVARRARAALTRVPLARHTLDRIVERVAEEGFDLNLTQLMGRPGSILAQGRVRGAFTRRGYENVVRELLNPDSIDYAGELWVLGLADRKDKDRQIAAQVAELSALYFRSYIEEWRNFVQGLRVQSPSSNDGAIDLLSELMRGQPPPLSLLLHKVHYNLQLKPKETVQEKVEGLAQSALGALKDKLGLAEPESQPAAKDKGQRRRGAADPEFERTTAADVAAALQPFTGFAVPPDTGEQQGAPRAAVAYDIYHEQLGYVRDALQRQQDSPQESDQLLGKLQDARVRVRALITEQEPIFRPVFEALLWPPIEGAASGSTRSLAAATGKGYCNEVMVPFDRSIRGSYPFVRSGHDLPLDAFGTFYRPNDGVLWKFVKGTLGSSVEVDGDEYRFSKKLGASAGHVYSPALLQFLQRSHDLATVFYPRGSAEPKVAFEVRVHPAPMVATTTLSVGGKSIEYHNGPEKWYALSWPGETPEAGASFAVRGANGMHERVNQEGAWGLFRLLEQGTVTRSSNRVFSIAWQLKTHDVTLRVDIRPVRAESPFFGVPGRTDRPSLLQPLRDGGVNAPRQIVNGASPCKGG